MARRKSSLGAALVRMERDAARARQQQVRAQAQAARAAERAQTARLRAAAAQDREQRRRYSEARAREVAEMNRDLERQIAALESLLAAALARDPRIDFGKLKEPVREPPATYLQYTKAAPPPDPARFAPAPPAGLNKLFGGRKHQRAAAEGLRAYDQAMLQHTEAEQRRREAYRRSRAEFDAALEQARARTAEQHAAVDELAAGYARGEPEQIVSVIELALARSPYPDQLDSKCKVAFAAESRQLVVEYELPTVAAVPPVKAYRYVKTSDTVSESPRPAAQIRALYGQIVAQIVLRVLYEVFTADTAGHVETVVVNAVVDTVDPGSGRPIRPCLVTVRTTREVFRQLDLRLVEPLACLKHLSASVSKSPTELAPVRPVIEFSMLDPRFVAESDALSTLDERPNLLEMSPTEFEALIQNLFTKMGLEAKQTRPSRDGGVDCVAYDTRPIFGGKVVIQAKRYKNTVGVSAVRDLFGTLQNEGASKGILVTTSGYGAASFDFARNKPIELIDGSNLLYLLKTHADVDARIEVPDDWSEPQPDSGDERP